MTGSPIAGPEFIKRSVNGIFSGEDFTRFSCLGFALSTMLMFPAEIRSSRCESIQCYFGTPSVFFFVLLGPMGIFFSFGPLLASRAPQSPRAWD